MRNFLIPKAERIELVFISLGLANYQMVTEFTRSVVDLNFYLKLMFLCTFYQMTR